MAVTGNNALPHERIVAYGEIGQRRVRDQDREVGQRSLTGAFSVAEVDLQAVLRNPAGKRQ
jgi:hypothetical protein